MIQVRNAANSDEILAVTKYGVAQPAAGDRLIGILLAVAILGLLFVLWDHMRRPPTARRRSRFRFNSPSAKPSLTLGGQDLSDPHSQMEAVARIDFETMPLLNREEARLLPVLERIVRDLDKGHRVMAQTSLGEVIRPRASSGTDGQRGAAYASINSKRLDFAIFDRFGTLALAVEYQGSGHHQNAAFLRDAVKREALRKAGVQMLEVAPDFKPDLVSAQVRTALGA